MEDLPEEVDVVVMGTGLCESMVAAALSRIGMKVLHIDRNCYYGSHWATFNLDSLIEWANMKTKDLDEQCNGLNISQKDDISNVSIYSFLPEKSPILKIEKESTPESMKELNTEAVENFDKKKDDLSNFDKKEDDLCNFDKKEDDSSNPDKKEDDSSNFDKKEDDSSNFDKKENDSSNFDKKEDDSSNFGYSENFTENANEEGSKQTNDETVKNTDKPNNGSIEYPENKSINATADIENQVKQTSSAESESMSSCKSVANTSKTISRKEVKQLSPSLLSQAKIKKGEDISMEDLHILSRKFNLDLTFKFLFSAGPLVATIIKANISHYTEFKVVNRMLMLKNEKLLEVPCNRSDVFTSPYLSVIEKRTLMKFLSFCMEGPETFTEETIAMLDLPFNKFLQARRLSESLQEFIIYSIAMIQPNTVAKLAIDETRKFLLSLGKYGKSPFIWPLFGVGELPQAFCRMSAVFGGTYCLNKSPDEFNIEDNKCTSIVIGTQKIKCKHVILENYYIPTSFKPVKCENSVSRAILITNKSLLTSDEECLTLMTIPPLAGKSNLVRVLELGPASSACPSGLFVIHLTCKQTCTAHEDLHEYTKLLTCTYNKECLSEKPCLLWSLYFNHAGDIIYEDLPSNFFTTLMPGNNLGFHEIVEKAEQIFKLIVPEEEFMLSVPNPEDIIWDSANSEEGSESLQESDNNLQRHDQDKTEV